MEAKKSPALGIVSLVASVISVLLFTFTEEIGLIAPVLALVFGIVGIIMGAIGRKKSNRGLSTAGMVIGIIVTAIMLIAVIAGIVAAGAIMGALS